MFFSTATHNVVENSGKPLERSLLIKWFCLSHLQLPSYEVLISDIFPLFHYSLDQYPSPCILIPNQLNMTLPFIKIKSSFPRHDSYFKIVLLLKRQFSSWSPCRKYFLDQSLLPTPILPYINRKTNNSETNRIHSSNNIISCDPLVTALLCMRFPF